jgi:hypothetical protein
MARFLIVLALSVMASLAIIAFLPKAGIARAGGEIAWTASLYSQKTRMAEEIEGPRILVIGGSSSLFSFDARAAQERLKVPVVNFGTHAGLGLDYILERASRLLRPGDTVILVPEYELLTRSTSTSEHTIQMAIFYDPQFLQTLPWRDRAQYLFGYNVLPSLVSAARTFLGYAADGRNDIVLDQTGNARGNTVALSNVKALREAAPGNRPIAAERIADLREFSERAKSLGIRIFVVPPALIETPAYVDISFRRFQKHLERLYGSLGMQPVGDSRMGFLSPEDMYDSVYHANDRGRTRYTQRVLASLCQVMTCP